MSNEEMTAKLGRPFPREAIKTRQGGGGRSFQYVEGHTVIHQLIDATDNTWSLEVREITSLQLGSKTLLQARVALTIPGLGTREHIGVQAIDERGGEDLVKGVVTDALKKAATLFGVGLELYGPDYGAGEIAAPRHDAPVSRQNAPQRQETPRPVSGPGEASPKQLGMIRGLAKQKGISPDKLEARCSQLYSAPLDHLSKRDASDLIERLQAVPDAADDTDNHNDSATQGMIADFDSRHPAEQYRQ
jgi:hypothetical protein